MSDETLYAQYEAAMRHPQFTGASRKHVAAFEEIPPMTTERTIDRLVRDLAQSGAPPDLIERARAGAYDDYESDSATPLGDLIRDLERAGLHLMAQAARHGAYEGTREEAEAWMAREGRYLFNTWHPRRRGQR